MSTRVLIIAPHPDDEVIGCGGTLRLCVKNGERASVVFLTSGELGLKQFPQAKAWRIREAEAKRAAQVLGLENLHFLRQPDWMLADRSLAVADGLKPILQKERPDVIYLPHPDDEHPDHRAALPILRSALRRCDRWKPELLGYEVWTPLRRPEKVVDISRVMPLKLRALRAHRSQLDEFDYVRAVSALNQFRGALVGKCKFAETFEYLSSQD